MRRRYLLIAMLGLLCSATSASQGPGLAGRPLTEVLTELQARGLRLVYSSAAVTPDMKVEKEPAAGDPRSILEQVLRPHGLEAVDGPGGTVLVVVAASAARPIEGSGELRVVLTAAEGSIQSPESVVEVGGTDLRARVATDGSFVIPAVPAGTYTVTAVSPGFVPHSVDGVVVRPGQRRFLRLHMVRVSIFLDEVVVTPSHFRLLDRRPERRQFLDRDEVRQMPHIADDLYRAVKRLPGAAGSDFTAKINVRGGDQDELLVILDGLELYEPFHLKDFQSVFSTVDSEAIGSVDFLTGGFPVEYGDRMSGVMDISMLAPTGPASAAVEIGTLNARVSTRGSFDDGRGRFFASGRAWYPDAVVRAISDPEASVTTDYYDVLAHLEYDLGRRSLLSANTLLAYDDLGFADTDVGETQDVRARYASASAWLNLRTQWSERAYSQTVLSAGRLTRHREGAVDDVEDGRLEVDDARAFEFAGLGQDWTVELGPRSLLKAGFDIVRQEASYDYFSRSTLLDPDSPTGPLPPVTEVDTQMDPEGTSYSAYLADRVRIADSVVFELGLRWDRQTWVGAHQLSPRVNFMCALGPGTTLRAGWGRFYQSQRLNELQVEDGVQAFFPAQLANHWLISLEHGLGRGVEARIEIFRKDLSRLRPRFENLFSPLHLFPEAEADRVMLTSDRGLVRGLEAVVKGRTGRSISWWASYVLSRAEDRIDGPWQPRSWDQTHAATLGANLDLPHGWSLGIVGLAHTGWPTTPVSGEIVPGDGGELRIEPVVGERNSDRYPSFFKLDLRVSKTFHTSHGELELFAEVLNATNRDNVCCTEDFELEIGPGGTVVVRPELRYWAPIVPTLGVGWRF